MRFEARSCAAGSKLSAVASVPSGLEERCMQRRNLLLEYGPHRPCPLQLDKQRASEELAGKQAG